MSNKQNMYRVNYQVMEGNHYAGGWGDRYEDVEELGDVQRFRNIVSVTPIYIEIHDPVSEDELIKAIGEREKIMEREAKLRSVKYAEEQLNLAKAALDD